MTNQHSDTKIFLSSAGVDHYAVNQGVLPAGHEDHLVDVVAFTDHSIMEEPLSSKENEMNSLPATAMVLGLGAAVCFVLLVIYIVVKVHFCKKETQKNNKSSTISHDTLKNPPSTTSPAYPIDSFNKNWYTDEQVPDQMQSEPNVWPYSFICRTQIMLQKAICFFTVLPSSLNRLLPSVF